MTMWHMRNVCWVTKAKHTHSHTHTLTHPHTHTPHTHSHTHSHTHTHPHTFTSTHTHTHTLTHTHSHTLTHTHTFTSTHTHSLPHTLTHHTHTHTHALTHTHTHSHPHTLTPTHTHTHSLTHTHSHAHTLARTHTHTRAHTHTHTHTHTICNNYCFSPATKVARTHLYVTSYVRGIATLGVGWDQVCRPAAASWCIVPPYNLVRPANSKAVTTTSVHGVSRVSVGSLLTFRRNALPPSSGQKLQSSAKTMCFLTRVRELCTIASSQAREPTTLSTVHLVAKFKITDIWSYSSGPGLCFVSRVWSPYDNWTVSFV